jgi:hypothetical protein
MDSTATVGTSMLFARQDHIHPSDTSRAAANTVIRYDTSQSLTAAQQQQARQNIYAAPFDAMAYSGMQINGGMEVSQERGATGTSTNSAFVCDGWRVSFAGTMGVNAAQLGSYFAGFISQLVVTTTTAQASLGVNDFAFIGQGIEGYRTARLGWGTSSAQPITIGFWSQHHRPGLYSGTIRNGIVNRSYGFTYTQTVADVPQYNTITIPGDTTGTWATDNTGSMFLSFAQACGTNFAVPSANTWSAGNYVAAPGQVNGVGATSDVFRITGVSVHPGNEAPSAARSPFIMRPYDQELATCKRYWQKYNMVVDTAAAFQAFPFPVEMRSNPTITGGGAGFNSTTTSASTIGCYQTGRAFQILIFDSRL